MTLIKSEMPFRYPNISEMHVMIVIGKTKGRITVPALQIFLVTSTRTTCNKETKKKKKP